jgi:hypothetical protein
MAIMANPAIRHRRREFGAVLWSTCRMPSPCVVEALARSGVALSVESPRFRVRTGNLWGAQ